jgi:hypothetical protein
MVSCNGIAVLGLFKDLCPQASATQRRALSKTASGFSDERWRGLDCSFVEAAILLEEFGRGLVLEPFVSSAVLCAEAPARGAIVSAAVVVALEAARVVGGQGIQLHGGIGVTQEYAMGHYFKQLVAFEKTYGDGDWHLDRLAHHAAP